MPRPLNVVPFFGYLSFLFWDSNHKIGHPIEGATFKGLGRVSSFRAKRLQVRHAGVVQVLCIGWLPSRLLEVFGGCQGRAWGFEASGLGCRVRGFGV